MNTPHATLPTPCSIETECWSTLQFHVGADYAISNRNLAQQLSTNERSVREIVHNLRMEGRLICSSRAHGGYYLPETREESERCIAEFQKQCATSLAMLAKLKKMTVRDLVDQLSMEVES